MNSAEPTRDAVRVRLAWYVAVAVLSVAYLSYNFRLHRADLSVPLATPNNDAAALLSLVTAVREDGWPWVVTRLGAPGTAERYDYPLPELAHYLTIRLIDQFTSSPFETFNWWCLLSYPVTAVCAFGVLRACGVSRPVGLALAMIYSFLPYHAGRAFTHTMLAYYHTVPLILLPAVWIANGRLPFFSSPGPSGRRSIAVLNRTTGWAIALGVLVAVTSPYYAFFGCFFLAVAGLYRALNEGSWRPLWSAVLTAAVVSAAGFVCSLPFVLAQREHGPNPAVAHRNANEAEVYCLKVTQLALPTGDHRVGPLGHVTRTYNAEAPNSNENRDSVLGIVGVTGFLILLGRLLLFRNGPTLMSGLSILNVSAVLLGASGGFGGLFNFLVFPQIRCYNRVCVFIAFWSLLAVGLLVDRWAARGWRGREMLVAAGLLAFGLWDTTSVHQAPRHSELRAQHAAWADFVYRMEEAMPPGAMVFQLPAASYPEVGVTHRMPDYAHLACHSFSRTLRWSYGTARNRRWDEWHRSIAAEPPEAMVSDLCLAGFSGVYVDRRGYADGGQAIIADLRRLLGPEVVSAPGGEQALFSLARAEGKLRSSIDSARWDQERERVLNRPCVLCQEGFFPWSAAEPAEPRRAMYRAALRLINPSSAPRRVKVTLNWERHAPREIDVHVRGPTLDFDRHYVPRVERQRVEFELRLPPGEHRLTLESTPEPVGLPRMHCAWTTTVVELAVHD
ncbi:MAG TPA: hypothetical protein VKE40_11660 [Gemmataceae bacterium]|nr:hypothetical protein [Gemmataceae bacterium]